MVWLKLIYIYTILVIYLVGLWVFVSKRKHLLVTLLILEFIALGVFMGYIIILNNLIIFFSLVYIIITSCEGALGLRILVTLRRTHGGDYFKRFNLDY